MLDPARLRVILRELDGDFPSDTEILIDQQGGGARGALIDGENVFV